jgi:serine O-acetyltransferase
MLKLFISDVNKYKGYSDKPTLILLLTQQALWAILVYRINNSIYKSGINKVLKKIVLRFGLIFQKLVEILTGISLPYSAEIGASFYIGHFGGIVINPKAVIGDNCNISQGVTIGISGRNEHRGVPIIGNNIYIGVNAVIAGKIIIGDNVVIAANSLVTKSVPDNITVMGVPAKKVNDRNSVDYI